MTEASIEKRFAEVIEQRRSTRHFGPDLVPEADLRKIVNAGLAAPSGYNLQPWRFVVVRDLDQRRRLREAALGQSKVEEAPVVIVACGDPCGWKNGDLEEMLRLGDTHGRAAESEAARRSITRFLGGEPGNLGGIGPDIAVWINRQVMIAFTTMMWMAEVLGYDTAPLEGFWEDKVKQVLEIPSNIRVVALLAIGHSAGPNKTHTGRFVASRLLFSNRWDEPLPSST